MEDAYNVDSYLKKKGEIILFLIELVPSFIGSHDIYALPVPHK